jgi:uncharacterized protein YodC (DUF2158 family)
MAKFQVGDLVVLKSGSMRMCVESVDDEGVATVWCNEGVIGRDRFDPVLLNKWEDRGGDRPQGGRGFGGDRDRGGRGGDRDGPPHRGHRDDGPPRKQGWDGKPRDKKYYRKDD